VSFTGIRRCGKKFIQSRIRNTGVTNIGAERPVIYHRDLQMQTAKMLLTDILKEIR
jgi:hypothetical protein